MPRRDNARRSSVESIQCAMSPGAVRLPGPKIAATEMRDWGEALTFRSVSGFEFRGFEERYVSGFYEQAGGLGVFCGRCTRPRPLGASCNESCFTPSVFKVVLQKSIPTQIGQLSIYVGNSE